MLANKMILVALAISFVTIGCVTGLAEYYPAKDENGLWGYIDKDGTWVISPTYVQAEMFLDNHAFARDTESTYIINATGERVFAFSGELEYWRELSGTRGEEENGIFIISGDDGCFGFFDLKSGTFSGFLWYDIIPPEGNSRFALVQDADWRWGYADCTNGEEVIACQYDEAYQFIDGLALVSAYRFDDESFEDEYIVIDEKGNRIMPESADLQWFDLSQFGSGLIPVTDRTLCGYCDKNGELVIPVQYLLAYPFQYGWAKVQFQEGDWGRIAPDGTVIIRGIEDKEHAYGPWFEPDGSFTAKRFDGSVAAFDSDGQLLFLIYAKNIVDLYRLSGSNLYVYETAVSSESGYVIDKYQGFVDENGQFISIAQWEYDENPLEMSEGYIPVKKDGAYGYINETGKMVIDLNYIHAGAFSDGIAYVETLSDKGKMYCGYINKQGAWVAFWE